MQKSNVKTSVQEIASGMLKAAFVGSIATFNNLATGNSMIGTTMQTEALLTKINYELGALTDPYL